MSHTSSAYHDVAGVSVSQPQLTSDKRTRYQNVRIHFADGGTHDITAFLMPNANSFPLSVEAHSGPGPNREPRTLGEATGATGMLRDLPTAFVE